ncbi:uncharacterized protein IUM83_05433 [Phytophthora cinnamomi]|uniref:uncharacterized protein n=1 Tax=Phytophthora cinnamomi TaxID=4785 RepID=UPI003559F797|nr:hypothetical protein IUM83_05433 [Phytophthora cinnamomi]
MENKQHELGHADPASELDKESEVPTRGGAVAFLENHGAVVKSKSPSNAALLKAGLKTNLSPAEATAQLRVLCRKFAALTEKVKEETKVREAAEREVRRLKALLDKDSSPVVASCRAETQAYVRELKETQEKLKRELRLEKEKNERIVAKALELEREKSALLASQSQQQTQTSARSQQDTNSGSLKHQSAWDKEQVYKIQSTLKLTIEELEEELSRKEEEVQTYRERSQRDRVRIKALEDEIRAKDDAQHAAQEARRQLEADLRQAQNDITSELENMQRIHDQAQEDRALRDTLEQQLVTLGEVNAALEQRSRALVRRLELSAAVTQECQDLKLQLRDAEVDNETLVQTIRNLKDEQFGREKDWKVRLESAKEEKAQVEQQCAAHYIAQLFITFHNLISWVCGGRKLVVLLQ